jgi:hypothetical protein
MTRYQLALLAIATGILAAVGTVPAAKSNEGPAAAETVAAQVDRLLAEELFGGANAQETVAKRVDDAVYLRRVSLDIVGELPAPGEMTAFVLDPAPDKRRRVVERLLADNRYGENWGRYWRDVIMYRRSEERAVLATQPLVNHLTQELNANTPWNKLAASFITALGEVRVEGQTGLIMAQGGRPEETAAEVARIFLGIQIQCAQCHDHPTDRWKREEFHQLAAFFPRVAVRPTAAGDIRSFAVVADDGPPGFGRGDNANRFRGTPEHYMPDLSNPSSRGTLVEPAFFVSGQKLPRGTKDADRRGELARWLTSPENPWFAKALVNRVWSELVGEGFYEPVDDIGPDRECSAPRTLDALAAGFTASQYDVKWLYRTVTATDAYQRASHSRRHADGLPFASNCLQRLRGDQLYSTLVAALQIDDRGTFAAGRGPYGGEAGTRGLINRVFGYDPSLRRDEVAGSIPQALALMNSRAIQDAISAQRSVGLGTQLVHIKDNESLVVELYLRCLAREPSDSELKTCLDYVKEVGDRNEAFEDILWALVNSTEFLHRR